MDTIGFGESSQPSWPPSIEGYSRVVGRARRARARPGRACRPPPGGVIAVEVAAAFPERVERLVLSSTPYADAEFRRRRADRPLTVDVAETSEDGSHLVGLRSRSGFYPPRRPDLLDRYVVDALRAGASRGAATVRCTRTGWRIGCRPCAPVLLVSATEDPYAYPEMARMAAAIPGARIARIEGGMVPLPDGHPRSSRTRSSRS